MNLNNLIYSMYSVLLDTTPSPKTPKVTAPTPKDTTNLLSDILGMIKNFAIIGGALWLIWGVIVFASGLKDKNGPALQAGIWQIIGGGLIIAAATYIGNII